MLRFSKALTLSGFTLLTVILAGGITNVQAALVCTSTMVLPGGDGTVADSALGAGVCVESQDKLYGNFNFGNLPAGGVVTFSFETVTGIDQHSIEFSAPLVGGTTYTDSYEVEVVEGSGFPTNNSITQLRADIPQTIGTSTLVQTTSVAPNSGSINLSKTANVVSGSDIANFTMAQNVTDLMVSSTLAVGSGSDAQAQLNTIEEAEQVVATPEPASVETLVLALSGLAFGFLKLKSRWS